MPALVAFSATSLPTALATSILVPLLSFKDLEDAATKVTPATSSINCTEISLLLLKTDIRGFAAVPETIFLIEAYRVLDGRLISYMGVTEDQDFWSATFGPGHFTSL